MNDTIYYNIPFYKFSLNSDIDLGYGKCNEKNEKLQLLSLKGNNYKKEKIFEKSKGMFEIQSPIAAYSIDFYSGCIRVKYNSNEDINSTLFNLPAGVLAAYKGDMLLHSSSICDKNRIFAFCAKKGTGKSTIISFLGKKSQIFADDTIYLSANKTRLNSYATFKRLKLNKDIYDIHKTIEMEAFDCAKKTTQNKAYADERIGVNFYEDSEGNLPQLSTIFFLHRGQVEKFETKVVSGFPEKMSLLLDNYVGIEYFSSEMIKGIINSNTINNIMSNVNFVHLFVPDSLLYLKNNYEKMLNYLMEKF